MRSGKGCESPHVILAVTLQLDNQIKKQADLFYRDPLKVKKSGAAVNASLRFSA
jgi:hypothetical protein